MTLVNYAWDVLKKENSLDETVGNAAMNICRDFQKEHLDEESMYMALEKAQKLIKCHFSTNSFSITDSPAQWVMIDTDLWQNVVVKNVFSTDNGKTYYFQNDPNTSYNSVAS